MIKNLDPGHKCFNSQLFQRLWKPIFLEYRINFVVGPNFCDMLQPANKGTIEKHTAIYSYSYEVYGRPHYSGYKKPVLHQATPS